MPTELQVFSVPDIQAMAASVAKSGCLASTKSKPSC